MKRLLFLAFLLYSIQYAYAQTITGRMEIFHSKEVTDSLLQDYVGIWKYEDTLNRLVFQVELITMDNSRTIALRGRYSLNKDGEYITNEFNNPYIIAYKGKAFGIEKMLVFPIDDYYAIGAGEDFASGALYMGASPKEAVKAACELCAFVSEPIITESIKR